MKIKLLGFLFCLTALSAVAYMLSLIFSPVETIREYSFYALIAMTVITLIISMVRFPGKKTKMTSHPDDYPLDMNFKPGSEVKTNIAEI